MQLDLGLPFESHFEGDTLSIARNHRTTSHSPEAFPNLSLLSHYKGTSSSSGLSENPILSIDNSSCTSTAPTSPIDSDGESSVDKCAALDFPEPPPIGSPVIRRMRSSPWFLSADEVGTVLAIPGRGERAALDRLKLQSRNSPMYLEAESPKSPQNNFGYLKENPLGFYHGEVPGMIDTRDTRDEGTFRLSHRRNSAFLDEHVSSTQHGEYFRPPEIPFYDKKNNLKVPHTEFSSTSFGRLPRIIRKMASMRSESHRTQDPPDAPNGSTVSLQRPVPRVRSFRTILRVSNPFGANFMQDSRQSNKGNFFRTDRTAQPSKIKTKTNAGEDKQRRQSSSHMVYENYLPGLSSMTLGPSCQQAMSWREDLNKSFIDISPDRKVQSKGRGKEKMKSLLSKANEIFRWGRKASRPQVGKHS